MGLLDLNNDGKVNGADVVYALKGVVVPVVAPIVSEAITEAVADEVFEGSDEWRDSCRRTCAKSDWTKAPASVQAIPKADSDYIIDMVGAKYEAEVAAKAEALAKRAIKALAEKLGVTV